jgi:hypothetical protein
MTRLSVENRFFDLRAPTGWKRQRQAKDRPNQRAVPILYFEPNWFMHMLAKQLALLVKSATP